MIFSFRLAYDLDPQRPDQMVSHVVQASLLRADLGSAADP
jgi:hypothetical protein